MAKIDFSAGGNQSVSDSQQFDYAGEDLVAKRADELSNLRSSRKSAVLGQDLAGMVGQRQRIRDLQQYINAYGAGNYGASTALGPVLAPKRLSGISSSVSSGRNANAGAEIG
jgi:hypothetical protein